MKRIFQWVLWSPRNALVALFGLLTLPLLAMIFVGGSSDSTAAAEPDTTPTPVESQSFTMPSVSTAPLPPAPTPTVPAATPTVPGAGAGDLATPEGVADAFMRTWLEVNTMERAAWEAKLIPLTSGPDMPELIRTVDPTMIPAARVVLAQEKSKSEQQAHVEVGITNGETYYVDLTMTRDGLWRIVSADPYGGDHE